MNELENARQTISEVDAEMAALFEKRMAAVRRIAAYKKEKGLPIRDPAREEELIRKNGARIEDEPLREYYIRFLRGVMETSRAYQEHLISEEIAADPGTCTDESFTTIPVELGKRSYALTLGSGAIGKAGEIFDLKRKVLIVTDDGVPPEYANRIAAFAGEPTVFTVPAGEASKSFARLEELLGAMLGGGFTRHDCAVAVGGGVVGDLTGLAASLYMRGIDFYNVPTTLLAQVDSSVGGKTAVDFRGTKNLAGSFWQPKAVLIDPDTLATLPRRQLCAGMAEALKMSLTSDAELFRVFEEGDPFRALPRVIEGALRIKKAVVEADEREAGLRKILNFGHTIGHAVESAASPKLLHGECVALGMLPMCAPELRERLVPVYEKLGLPQTVSLPSSEIREAMRYDKKAAKDAVDAVIVDEPGRCRIERMTVDELAERYESVFGRNGA